MIGQFHSTATRNRSATHGEMTAMSGRDHATCVGSLQGRRAGDEWGNLMAAALDGDARAYRQLLTEIDIWLHRYFARRLPPASVADAAQETMLVVHVRRHTFEPGRPFMAWLAGIARYKWIDCLRALARNPAAPGQEYDLDVVASFPHTDLTIAAAALLD